MPLESGASIADNLKTAAARKIIKETIFQ